MLPVVALLGRPNVGKSTLFNQLTRSRDALVADSPGLTRDRQYGIGRVGPRPFIVIDTGGIGEAERPVEELMEQQSLRALEEADIAIFVVDGRQGLTPADEQLARAFRKQSRTVLLAVNKAEGQSRDEVTAEFHALALGEPRAISATLGRGIQPLIEDALSHVPELEGEQGYNEDGIRVAVIGRPNVGKSTLINRWLGEERMVASDEPGTTRDAVRVPFSRDGQDYVLVDTAGVRRRARVHEYVEKLSVVKTLQAIEDANVVVALVDGSEGITDQDASIMGLALEAGRAMVVAVNKWDGIAPDRRERTKVELDLKLPFLGFAKQHFISAKHGTGVGELLGSVNEAWEAANRDLPTPVLTRALEDAVSRHAPPLIRGHRIKLRYAHQGGKNPPLIVIHGNQTERTPKAYRRYLENYFRQTFDLQGTPIQIEFRSTENPFKGRRNKLTDRQIQKRKRLKRHTRGK
ncbi:ribosome biogenesis GTPase Der [Natronospira bacteriovora]|uniref:GTPase Der n=1 Tax=Natronospira bacteriovora TaxID=3069753 RepID=A0ABU0W3W0_9GAMM|nr:ribosome biogenesis GTPase Der [Natronospira sp. AB-CW4]MDQ2068709.1 ribosome biogenesis GTPase Der [Natronospira sp. AB-CW4]